MTKGVSVDVATCPVAHGVDWLDQAFLAEPFDAIGTLREQSPVWYDEELGHYIVTRYADIEQVLLDRDTFHAANASSPIWPPVPEAAAIMQEGGYRRVPTLNNADPPRHGPMRKAVLACMSPRRLRALEPELREFTRACVAEMARRPRVDLVSSIAEPLPIHTALGLLGLPMEDSDQILEWSSRRVVLTYGHLPPDEQVAVAGNVVAFWNYIDAFVTRRDQERADDLTSDLLQYRDDNPDLVTTDDVLNIVYSMALAGHDSTRNAIANSLRRILAVPEQWQRLCAEPGLIPDAVEEGLRFDPPVMGHRRLAARDAAIGGTPVPAGAKIILLFASAHHDGAKFPDADVLDVSRPNARDHLSFGKGVHFCLGAPLARLELRLVLEAMREMMPGIRLVEGQEWEYSPNVLFRSLQHLLADTGVTATQE
ncbi:cytochrome P450 [Acidiferrimicrobium sp. IK]|uniref:cytochrome P450 n=1 Tax=Acidiferrimicrobium sp. IK TaxID=2871700 RepID=UPI0021CB1A96|nr:cytochrome P450 [Acidiferrimicrobium sp. IK]MCU4183470.1 cytochrome P450 [Acidiferrimicrobium sp. IK]